MATICTAVFHFASRLTGRPTLTSAMYSRKPETVISRSRMTSEGRSGARSKPTSIRMVAATRSLSAIGSSQRPKGVCWRQIRAR
jgi:hypothetical protein